MNADERRYSARRTSDNDSARHAGGPGGAVICVDLRSSAVASAVRGFTLIEILIAIMVLNMAMMGVMAVFAAAAGSHQRGVDGTEAAIIASSVVAEARASFRDRASLPVASGEKVPGRPRYSYDIEYIDLDGRGDEVLMRVRVRWAARGRGASVSFETILMRKLD
ncbi:MAG: type IV pilus modification PilV family protein [Planctomycetota bacterium]|jgi:hypothetical protein